ncbi:MAG: hypothetical protein ACOCV0_01100 [Alkalispirochaeta sp.]
MATEGSTLKGALRTIVTILVVTGVCGAPSAAAADGATVETFSVRDQPVGQVLLAFAEQTGLSVITDATVAGSVSLVLHERTPREILHALADAAELFVSERDGVFRLSRVRVRRNGTGRWVLTSRGAPLERVAAAIAAEAGIPVFLEGSDGETIHASVHAASARGLLERLAVQIDLSLESRGGAFTLVSGALDEGSAGDDGGSGRGSSSVQEPVGSPGECTVTATGDAGYDLVATGVAYRELCAAVADATGVGLLATDPFRQIADTVTLSAPDRDTLYRRLEVALGISLVRNGDLLLLGRGGSGHGGDRRDFAPLHVRTVLETGVLPAENAADVLRAIPALTVEWIDPGGYRLLISGLERDVVDASTLLATLGARADGIVSFEYRCAHTDAASTAESLRNRFPDLAVRHDPGTNSIVGEIPAEVSGRLNDAIEAIDSETRRFTYRCNHLPSDRAAASLSTRFPTVSVTVASDERLLLLDGPVELRPAVTRFLADLDRPVPQVRYDICVLQYQHSDSRQHGISASFERDRGGVQSVAAPLAAAATYDRLTSIHFDFLSALGYRAALGISEELTNNTARLIIDTTLRAADGVTAHLENSSTFRYRDVLGDDESEGYRAVTREIESGLTVEISGETRGDRTIAMDITVSLSKNGADMSGNGNPPPTTEKRVHTAGVVGFGEPIVVGGLLQREESDAEHRFPLLGSIPLVRRLVNGSTRRMEETELVIYVTAHPLDVHSPPVKRAAQLDELRRYREEM